MSKSKSSSNYLFIKLLAVAFIVLKLCNVIDWSWWWVLSPLWIPFALVIMFFVGWIIYEITITKRN